MRQQDEIKFISVLNNLRFGNINKREKGLLETRKSTIDEIKNGTSC